MRRPRFIAVFALLIAAGPARAAAAEPSAFVPLGDLPGGAFVSLANDVSDDGSVVVGESEQADGREAFRWTAADGMQGLGDLPGGTFRSTAWGVSGDGSVIVGASASGFSSPSGNEAFRWESGTGLTGLGSLVGGLPTSDAFACSLDGAVVVGRASSSTSTDDGFRWTSALGMHGIGDLAGGLVMSRAEDVSDDGQVVVGIASATRGSEAFRWTGTGPVDGVIEGLGDLPGGLFASHALGVSGDGMVVVGHSSTSGGFEAFRWTRLDGMSGLGDLPGGRLDSTARDASFQGEVIVGRGWSEAGPEAFVWTEADGMRTVNALLVERGVVGMTGWTDTEANAVSDDGTVVVGHGLNPAGDTEAWLAVIDDPVEPEEALVVLKARVKGSDSSKPGIELEAVFDTRDVDDLEGPATLVIGDLVIPVQLKWKAKKRFYKGKGGGGTVIVEPSAIGSSRTEIAVSWKGDPDGLVPTGEPVPVRFVVGALDIAGSVSLQGGKFKWGGKGVLVTPNLTGVEVKLKQKNGAVRMLVDVCLAPPTEADPVPVPYPDIAVASDVAGSQKSFSVKGASAKRKGNKLVYKDDAGFKAVADYDEEELAVAIADLGLAALPTEETDVVVRFTLGDDENEVRMRVAPRRNKLQY